ncbi:hypothetical protein BK799_29630 [Rhodococcus sp. D-1]|nr:hypothetical protein BK799_29630 [Rhodococcus sp. D-1]
MSARIEEISVRAPAGPEPGVHRYCADMTISHDDDDALLTLAFSLQSNPGAYAVVVGAGVSAAAGVPTAWGVLTDLIAKAARIKGDVIEQNQAEKWYLDYYDGQAPRYEVLLATLAPTQTERQRLLRQYFEPAEAPDLGADDDSTGPRPTLAHKSIARLIARGVIKVVITMNFDRLLERAIRAEGIEPTVVASEADVAGLDPLHTLNCCVIHLHGDYLNPESMLNTTEELEGYRPKMRGLLHRVLEDYGLIVAGWSATYDPALRSAISEHYSRRFTMTWVEPYEQSEIAADLRELMKANLVPLDADAAFGKLVDSVESIAVRQSRHPLTVAVAAETAKRELSGRWTAIGLHDALGAEFTRLHEHPQFHLITYDGYSNAQYKEAVQQVWEATKVPAALVAVLSYWGEDTSDSWWMDELERFSVHPRVSGQTAVIKLRMVVGSVLFYAASVGAVAGKRYDLLTRLLRLHRTDPWYNRRESLASVLDPLGVYDGLPDPEHQHHMNVRGVLLEALGLGHVALDEAWQLFELLRAATSLMKNEQFDGHAQEFLAKSAEFDELKRQRNEDAGSVNQQAYHAAWEARERVVGTIADLGSVHAPHLFVNEVERDGRPRWGSPIADRLAADLALDGDDHPFVKARIGNADSSTLRLAISAVGVQVTRRAYKVEREVLFQPGTKGAADELWLDTGMPTAR